MEKIVFQDLPFRPVANQVIYIETHFDTEVNDFIMSHLDALRDAFRLKGREFFYLPTLTLDHAIEEKMLYAAPYLTPKILGNTPIKTSSLMYFLKSENAPSIGPSLIFNGRHGADPQESIFDMLPLNAEGSPLSTLKSILRTAKHHQPTSAPGQSHQRVLGMHGPSAQEECLAESLPTEECLPMPTAAPPSPRHRLSSLPVKEFRDAVEHKKTEKAEKQYKKKQTLLAKLLRSFRLDSLAVTAEEETDYDADYNANYNADYADKSAEAIPSLTEIEDETLSIEETKRILQELRHNVQRLRLEGVSLMAIHEFIDSQEPLSRMVITSDYRIILPDYNNMEILMGALPKAIYFLFLRYPEGIVCKHMPDYYNELLCIYRQLRPSTDEARLNLTITKVVNPLGNALNENIARIRKAFVEKFDEHLACNYIITGERGQQYAVTLDRDLISWEE